MESTHQVHSGCLQEKYHAVIWVSTWTTHFFFMKFHNYSESAICRYFLKRWIKKACNFKESNWENILPISASKQKLAFQKTCICHHELDSLIFTDLPDEISGDSNKCDPLIFYNEKGQHLEDLHNTVNQYFPEDQYLSYKTIHG